MVSTLDVPHLVKSSQKSDTCICYSCWLQGGSLLEAGIVIRKILSSSSECPIHFIISQQTYPLWSCGSRQISSTFFEEAKLLGPFLDSFSTPRAHSGHTDGGGYRCNSELLSSVQIWLRSITMTTLVKSSKLPLLLAENEMERLNIGQTSENWQYYVIFVNSCVLQWRYCRFSLLILLSLCSWLEWTWSRQTWFINCYALSLLTHTRV